MRELKRTLLFFDFEMTGENSVFSQPTRFTSLRATIEGEPIQRRNFRIKRRKDVVPALEFLRSLSATLRESDEEVTEYEAACRIHQELTEPGTIALGFNAFGRAHEVCRFLFFRNLLYPFAQEKAGCPRGDMLPLLVLFKVFSPNTLRFPVVENGKAGFSLEGLAAENGLPIGDRDTPAEKIEIQCELFRRLKEGNSALLEAGLNHFSPNEDRRTLETLKTVKAKRDEVKAGILLSYRAESKHHKVPAVLARTEKNDRQLWLLLESDFEAFLKGEQIPRPYIMTRRAGEVPFVIRPEKGLIGEERKDLIRKNLKVLERVGIGPFLEGIRPEFDEYPDLDLDASLYQGDVATEFEASGEGIHRFHNALMSEVRWSAARSLPSERLHKLGLRVFFRNGFECDQASRARDDFFQSQLSATTVDHRGRGRRSIKDLQGEIEQRLADFPAIEELSALREIAREFSIPLNVPDVGQAEGEDQEPDQPEIEASSEKKASRKKTGSRASNGKPRRLKKNESPFGLCTCGEPLVERIVLVVDSKCWSCSMPMKVAMTGTTIGGGQIGTPDCFTVEELEYAQTAGAILEKREREALANVCGSCNQMTGAFYVASHSPGQLETVEGIAPNFVFQVFETECPLCMTRTGA